MAYRKYKNKSVVVGDIQFDSKKEGKRFFELKILERAKKITDLQLQVKFELIPKQKGERACHYIADFVYKDLTTGETVVEDVKGYKRGGAYSVFSIKRKLMLLRYGIRVKEV